MGEVIDIRAKRIADAREYLEGGGLGEVIGFASIAFDMNQPKVQMDTDMAMALLFMASDACSTTPELLRVLKEARSCFLLLANDGIHKDAISCGILASIEAAIAKATGDA